ncbi:MAG: protein-tyrosine kinase [Lachnospiraceae bacterium]|nr:protein-tyrosine kinase [Lachnospiraceae bacterium]
METNIRQNDNDELEINLLELFWALWRNKIEIILMTVFGALVAFFISELVMTPQYTSMTSLYVLAKQDNGAITTADLSVGTQLTNDYVVLVTSRPVLEKTIAELELDMTASQLGSLISVSNTSNTRILKISVTYTDPIMARDIANSIRIAVGEQIMSVMNIDAVNTVEEASLPLAPSEPRVKRNTLIGMALGFVLAAGLVVLHAVMDDTVKTSEDVEKYVGLPVLGVIPIAENKEVQRNKE